MVRFGYGGGESESDLALSGAASSYPRAFTPVT